MCHILWHPETLRSTFIIFLFLWTQSRSQEQRAGSSTKFPASFSWATSNGTEHHIWALAGESSVCNKPFPLAPATAKLQAKVLGVSRTREGWISQGTEQRVSPLSILPHRTIPGKAAERKEIKHWRYAFPWAMEHCQVWIQKEEFLTSLPVIQWEPQVHMAPECSHVKMTCTLAQAAIPHPTWAFPSLLGIVQCYFSPFPGCQGRAGACSWPSPSGSHRSLLVSFPDAECVLKHCVHDPSDAKRGLNDIWDDFFHWNTK